MKKVIHLLHLWISLPLGIIFSVICLTGAILVFENETLQLLNPQADVSSLGKHAPERRELVGYDFFRQTLRIHRWLLDAPAKKVLWWPRNRRVLQNRLSVNTRKGMRRFWYDTHVSLGFYATLLLLVMCITGLVWSFTWWREIFWALFDFVPQEGRKRFLYTLHTGLWGGITTQVLYFLGALIGGTLPLTGYYLWWKKRRR